MDAFCVNDLVKGLSLNLQAQSLAKIGSTIDAEIISKEVTSLNRIFHIISCLVACFHVPCLECHNCKDYNFQGKR